MTTPKTIAEVLELISKLKSRKAVYGVAISHLRAFYRKTDAGPAELVMQREDLGAVPEPHIELSIIEMEQRIDEIDAELEQLQNQPVGGGTPPAAEQPDASGEPPAAKVAEDAAIAESAKKTAEQKGTPSGKPRPQGGRPS
jgi:DNA-binding transcriptional MerR regulator